jgi:group I intron endonuclease
VSCGVYGIQNLREPSRWYVGSSLAIEVRWTKHRRDLSYGKHHCAQLQRDWKRLGEKNFKFEILELTGKSDRTRARHETFWIEALDAAWFGYNKAAQVNVGLTNSGWHHTAEARRKIGRASRGVSVDVAAKRDALLRSPERRRVIAAALGTPEARLNLRLSHLGYKPSKDHCANLSRALKGRVFTSEHRKNIAAGLRGKPLSAEHGAKIAAANRRRKVSAETRAKMSASQFRRHRGAT